jgi:hypothetical protein
MYDEGPFEGEFLFVPHGGLEQGFANGLPHKSKHIFVGKDMHCRSMTMALLYVLEQQQLLKRTYDIART